MAYTFAENIAWYMKAFHAYFVAHKWIINIVSIKQAYRYCHKLSSDCVCIAKSFKLICACNFCEQCESADS